MLVYRTSKRYFARAVGSGRRPAVELTDVTALLEGGPVVPIWQAQEIGYSLQTVARKFPSLLPSVVSHLQARSVDCSRQLPKLVVTAAAVQPRASLRIFEHLLNPPSKSHPLPRLASINTGAIASALLGLQRKAQWAVLDECLARVPSEQARQPSIACIYLAQSLRLLANESIDSVKCRNMLADAVKEFSEMLSEHGRGSRTDRIALDHSLAAILSTMSRRKQGISMDGAELIVSRLSFGPFVCSSAATTILRSLATDQPHHQANKVLPPDRRVVLANSIVKSMVHRHPSSGSSPVQSTVGPGRDAPDTPLINALLHVYASSIQSTAHTVQSISPRLHSQAKVSWVGDAMPSPTAPGPRCDATRSTSKDIADPASEVWSLWEEMLATDDRWFGRRLSSTDGSGTHATRSISTYNTLMEAAGAVAQSIRRPHTPAEAGAEGSVIAQTQPYALQTLRDQARWLVRRAVYESVLQPLCREIRSDGTASVLDLHQCGGQLAQAVLGTFLADVRRDGAVVWCGRASADLPPRPSRRSERDREAEAEAEVVRASGRMAQGWVGEGETLELIVGKGGVHKRGKAAVLRGAIEACLAPPTHSNEDRGTGTEVIGSMVGGVAGGMWLMEKGCDGIQWWVPEANGGRICIDGLQMYLWKQGKTTG